jgi:methylmalonyl-CoA mutase
LAAGHKTLIPKLKEELKKAGGEHIAVVVGGVIPPTDYDFLHQNGADLIFGPGSQVTECATKIIDLLEK